VNMLSLSAPDAHPARVMATDDYLFVTEVLTGMIDVFPLRSDGKDLPGDAIGAGVVTASAGMGPFGMAMFDSNHLFVAEAGPPDTKGTASISTYEVGTGGVLTPITAALPNGQTASCWVGLSNDQRTAYTSNTVSGTISRYTLGSDGSATIANATEDTPGSGPIDMDTDAAGEYLYVLLGGAGQVASYEIQPDGTLTRVEIAQKIGLPTLGSQGLQAL
jgi:6-phosphogluconolactonase